VDKAPGCRAKTSRIPGRKQKQVKAERKIIRVQVGRAFYPELKKGSLSGFWSLVFLVSAREKTDRLQSLCEDSIPEACATSFLTIQR
jgi:hypothetical protein